MIYRQMRGYSWMYTKVVYRENLASWTCIFTANELFVLQSPFVKKSSLQWKDYRWFYDALQRQLVLLSQVSEVVKTNLGECTRACCCLRDCVAVRKYISIIYCAGQSHRRGMLGAFTDLQLTAAWSAFFFLTWSRRSRFCRGAFPFPVA